MTAESLIRLHRPSLVVIDGGLQLDRPTRLIETARKTRERVYYCMLAESVGQQASALAAGADLALLKGEPPTRVFGQVERLLQAA